MGYLIFAVAMAAILISALVLRERLSRSPGRSVDAFRRAISALTPENAKPREPAAVDAHGEHGEGERRDAGSDAGARERRRP